MNINNYFITIILSVNKMDEHIIENKNFWDIMFNELDKTTHEDWKNFVEKHDEKRNKKMDKQLFLRYRDHFDNLIREKYLLDNKTYDFENYDIEDFEFEKLDLYYEDGRECKIVKYDWDGEGKWSYINNITIRFSNGEIMEHVSGYHLFLTEESLEKYGWYFKEDDY